MVVYITFWVAISPYAFAHAHVYVKLDLLSIHTALESSVVALSTARQPPLQGPVVQLATHLVHACGTHCIAACCVVLAKPRTCWDKEPRHVMHKLPPKRQEPLGQGSNFPHFQPRLTAANISEWNQSRGHQYEQCRSVA